MSVLKINGKEFEPKFTFNSFKYMKDFDVHDFENAESNPCLLANELEILVMGVANQSPKIKIKEEDVQTFLEEYIAENDPADLLTELMEKLQESSFFKSLQKKAQ